jgi:hypothetical protein
MSVVQTLNLKKTYIQGTVPVPALKGVDIDITSGELVFFLWLLAYYLQAIRLHDSSAPSAASHLNRANSS